MKLFRTAIVAALVVVAGNGGTAFADDATPEEEPATVIVDGQEVSPGETVTFDADDIETGVGEAEELPPAQQEEVLDRFVELAQEEGSYVDPASTELVSLGGDSVMTAVPVGIELTEASVTFGEGFASATLSSEVEIDSDEPLLSGPGMAPSRVQLPFKSWVMQYIAAGDGSVIGDALFTRRSWKVTDPLPGVTFVSHRTASGEPNPDGNFGAEVNFRGLTMTSEPNNKANLTDWVEFAPAADVNNRCGEVNVTIVVAGFEFGSPFEAECNSYDMHRDATTPGLYELRYNGNSNEQNVFMKYSIAWTQQAGTSMSQAEYQSIYLSFDPSPIPGDDVYLPRCKDFGTVNVECEND